MSGEAPENAGPDFDWSWTNDGADWVPPAVDTSRPSVARIYDFYLGGKDNFAVDREAGAKVLKAIPDAREIARANRQFTVKAVQCMASEFGIRQFIDLGTGIPTSPNVHETARGIHPDAAVAYVDHDPVVLAHNRAMFNADPRIATVQHDLRNSAAVLTDPAVNAVIDFSQPVGLLCIAVMHFVAHDLAPDVLAQYTKALVPGSCLALTAACSEGTDPTRIRAAEAVYAQSNSRVIFRSRAQIEQLFEGYELAEPGLTDLTQWRNPEGVPGSTRGLAGVGSKH
jgi:hypothetical protein